MTQVTSSRCTTATTGKNDAGVAPVGWLAVSDTILQSHTHTHICTHDSSLLVRRSAIPKVHYSKACVPKLVYKLAEACYISVTGTNPNPKP